MKKRLLVVICSVALITAFVAACSPSASSTPVPTVAAPTGNQAPGPQTSTPQAVSPEDAAWAKVIQAAKKEGTVTAYSFNMTGDVGIAVSQAFGKKYGVKVDLITGGGSALAQRIMTEKRMGTIVADLMDANSFQIGNIKEAGATVSSADLPALREKGVWRAELAEVDPDLHILMHTLVYNSAFVNTNLVKPSDDPKSFREIADPKWKGKIVMIDPIINSGAANVFPTLIRRKFIDENTVRTLGRNDVHYTPTSSEAQTTLLAGTYAIDLLSTGATYGSLFDGKTPLPVRPIATEEGTVWANRAMGMVKDGPHPNATRLFLNWLLTQEGQTLLAKLQGATPVRNDVPDFVPSFLQIKPIRSITNSYDEEKVNTQLFKDGWLAKLMKGS